MRYLSGSAFRQALEERLRNQHLESGVPFNRLRKMIAFERFIARLTYTHPKFWVLKGGLALQLRLGERARTTKDMDLMHMADEKESHQVLRQAGDTNLDDWFLFEVGQRSNKPDDLFGGNRYPVRALLDGREFENFHIDVGVSDVLIGRTDTLEFSSLLSFAEISPATIECYPIPQQIAEKFHAITRPYTSGESSRTKDLIDILLLAGLGPIDAKELSQALITTFSHRETHTLPTEMPTVPISWDRSFSRLAKQVNLPYDTLSISVSATDSFLTPILQMATVKQWNPIRWEWD